MLTYPVDLSQGITESFFENFQQLTDKKPVVTKRLTEIVIELLQNIRKHVIASGVETLTVKKHDACFSIEACNQVCSNNIEPLRIKIIHLNTLDHAQLKNKHAHILRECTLSEKSGAGLGLYRIAIPAKTALQASFTKIDQDHSIFTLHINLNT